MRGRAAAHSTQVHRVANGCYNLKAKPERYRCVRSDRGPRSLLDVETCRGVAPALGRGDTCITEMMGVALQSESGPKDLWNGGRPKMPGACSSTGQIVGLRFRGRCAH